MVNKLEPERAGVVGRSKRSESGVLPASCTSLLVEEVASNRVVNNYIGSSTTYLFSYIPRLSARVKKTTNERETKQAGGRGVDED